jgi:phosphoglycerate transport regulatory protein PgtC
MAGNFKMVTERSFGVPEGVNSGDFGMVLLLISLAFHQKLPDFLSTLFTQR